MPSTKYKIPITLDEKLSIFKPDLWIRKHVIDPNVLQT